MLAVLGQAGTAALATAVALLTAATAVSAVVGPRLAGVTDALARRTGLGRNLAGALLLRYPRRAPRESPSVFMLVVYAGLAALLVALPPSGGG